MKFSVFELKDTITKYNKIFENGFRNEGVAIYLCNFGRYLIQLNILFNNIFASNMRLIEMNQQNVEWSIGTTFVGILVQITI